ncbi:MAG: class I SAM-dependent methyltransferase [Candidatus Shapirobacteria bacterium]|jgi:ubiquinone/menaquinone biosynthesis C-methylase UbiE
MPKSKVIKKGYINRYTKLGAKEERQFEYNCQYKLIEPSWDNTTIFLTKKFGEYAEKQRDLRVFDAGCGNGNYIIDEYKKIIKFAGGMDADKASTAKNICLDEIKFGNLEKIDYPSESFDVATSLWVAEHLENPEKVFKEIFRILKLGGIFLMATPNANCWLLLIKKLMRQGQSNFFVQLLYGRRDEDIFPTYYRANTVKEMTRLLKKAGFKDIEVKVNYDPGYTSFNNLTFKISNWLNKTVGRLWPEGYRQHLVVRGIK